MHKGFILFRTKIIFVWFIIMTFTVNYIVYNISGSDVSVTGFYGEPVNWNAVPTAGTIIKRIGPILVSKNYNIALNVK